MFLGKAEGTFPASGKIVALAGPQKAFDRWRVKQMVTTSTSINPTELKVYRGFEGGAQLDYTQSGNNDVSVTDIVIPNGEKLAFVWTGGTPGTIARCDIDGELERG